jgi:hypothetical protein
MTQPHLARLRTESERYLQQAQFCLPCGSRLTLARRGMPVIWPKPTYRSKASEQVRWKPRLPVLSAKAVLCEVAPWIVQSNQGPDTLNRGLDKRASCRKLEETKGWGRLGKTSLHQFPLTQSYPPPGISAKQPSRPCLGIIFSTNINAFIGFGIPKPAFEIVGSSNSG